MRDEFEGIYRDRHWGQTVRSGPGSDPAHIGEYVSLLERLLRELQPRSVVDLGCGDGHVASSVRWGDVDYTGVELVSSVVEELDARLAGPKMRFVCANVAEDPLPDAELAICKDVLQHWSNQAVSGFLPKLGRYPLALVTNDVDKRHANGLRGLLRMRKGPGVNADIPVGSSRPIRLREAPFHVDAEHIADLTMRIGTTVFTKEVLLLRN